VVLKSLNSLNLTNVYPNNKNNKNINNNNKVKSKPLELFELAGKNDCHVALRSIILLHKNRLSCLFSFSNYVFLEPNAKRHVFADFLSLCFESYPEFFRQII
jgi:hypothetical protein